MESEYFMVYPVHIDSNKTIDAGRKYAKEASVPGPNMPEIKAALEKLGLEYKCDANKRHPRDQLVCGRFSVKKEGSRGDVVRRIVDAIASERSRKAAGNKSKVPNLLNLVPRKKKGKGKK